MLFSRQATFLIIAITAGTFVFACLAWWGGKPAQPLWIDERTGDGAVLSLAAGEDPSGTEVVIAGGAYRSDTSGRDLRVVCFNAADGTMRWETREDRSLPNISKIPAINVDGTGNVLVGWDYWAVGAGSHPVVTKLSGIDGRKLWEWKAFAAGGQSGHLAVAKADLLQRVWIAGIHQVIGGEYRRFVALLDTRDGATHWERALNSARDANDRRATIHPLKDGDALVVAPPLGGEGISPWLVQRISGANGETLWHKDFLRENDRNLPGLTWTVDESHGHVVVLWSVVVSGRMQLSLVGYELATGEERWHTIYNPSDEFAGGVTEVTVADNGDIIAWGRHSYEITRRKWWRWHYEEGFWFPETETTRHERPKRARFSARNGALQETRLIADPDERINDVLTRSGRGVGEALFLRRMKERKQIEPWRAVRLSTASGEIRPDLFRRAPRGPSASLHFPRSAVLTPNGRIAIAGDPAEDKGLWRITVW